MGGSLVGIELETGDVLLRFVETTVESNGERHLQEARYRPTSKPPPYHCHPVQEERFTIVEGELTFLIDGQQRLARAGDELLVPRGAYHRAHNPGATDALVLWETRPALRTADFFYDLYTASRGRARPRLTEAAAILSEYRDLFRLARPPALIQRVVFGCLAPFGRRAVGRARAG